MNKLYMLCIACLIMMGLNAQNVGVGVTNPVERLDVAGNIRVAGEIRPNGAAGASGQVLTSNGAGVMSWANAGAFKNLLTFTDTTSTINWNVPAAVTKIWVEGWGGGGAGLEAGGGAGGYISLLLDVTPGTLIYFNVGKGGKDQALVNGSFTSNTTGGFTRIEVGGQYYIANGGDGALKNASLPYARLIPGEGGNLFTSVPATTSPRGSFIVIKGQAGGPYTENYSSIGSNQYFLTKRYGYGGTAPNTAAYTANGAVMQYSVILSPSSSTLTYHTAARSGVFPGGGGGGALGADPFYDTRSGSNGLILVHY